MATIIDDLDLQYKTSFSVGDFVLIRDAGGNIVNICEVVTTNPYDTTTTTTTTSTTSTTSTTTSSTTSQSGVPIPPDSYVGDSMDNGNITSGTYNDEQSSTPNQVLYTLVDLQSGSALVDQAFSLESLLSEVSAKYSLYNILDGAKINLTVSFGGINIPSTKPTEDTYVTDKTSNSY
mgnify:CR=1 FL=1